MARFQTVSCSQCGEEFGPRDSGYSHCEDHRAEAVDVKALRQALDAETARAEHYRSLYNTESHEKLESLRVLRDVLDQIDSLDDYSLTRDIESYKAEANWDSVLHNAQSLLSRMGVTP